MTSDPRAALSTFIAALETHLELSAVRRGENDPAVVTAYNKVADAFVAYDDALLDAFGEVTPLDVYSDEDDDIDDAAVLDDGDDPDEGDDLDDPSGGAGGYLGLDDEEYDVDDDDDDGDDDDEDDDEEDDDDLDDDDHSDDDNSDDGRA
ncbi:hypothetical protein [Ornithinimicrobium faecis]|uniref:Primosomal protein n=1 Tax=Ornithinimicrobium faecis TaxID=2934158 RepID=A0ABY4YPE7_9MICO|nr:MULTISPECIES: hypothetical protein [unclassified Ornithinimicrobium]USQ78228.1 hypothetical protein NF556_11220 [Ornithinimicrobium sp. HY1793]